MGFGNWDDNSRAFYSSTSVQALNADTPRDYFKAIDIDPYLDPMNIVVRESCDSEFNPLSNAIMIGLDVTGSMGDIAHQLAKDGLGKLIEGILEKKPVTDPHILFAAIGDVRTDRAPLQVSQFETDLKMVEQLNKIYVEGNGGGNDTESYDLLWHFAATRTKIDCFEKRNNKGYLFTVGDEMPPAGISKNNFRKVYSGEERDYTPEELLVAAQKSYHVFHLIVEQGGYARFRGNAVINQWKKMLGARAIPLNNYHYMPEVIIAAMMLSEADENTSYNDIIESFENTEVKKTLKHAFVNE